MLRVCLFALSTCSASQSALFLTLCQCDSLTLTWYFVTYSRQLVSTILKIFVEEFDFHDTIWPVENIAFFFFSNLNYFKNINVTEKLEDYLDENFSIAYNDNIGNVPAWENWNYSVNTRCGVSEHKGLISHKGSDLCQIAKMQIWNMKMKMPGHKSDIRAQRCAYLLFVFFFCWVSV